MCMTTDTPVTSDATAEEEQPSDDLSTDDPWIRAKLASGVYEIGQRQIALSASRQVEVAKHVEMIEALLSSRAAAKEIASRTPEVQTRSERWTLRVTPRQDAMVRR